MGRQASRDRFRAAAKNSNTTVRGNEPFRYEALAAVRRPIDRIDNRLADEVGIAGWSRGVTYGTARLAAFPINHRRSAVKDKLA
jgi:hypothetical protein